MPSKYILKFKTLGMTLTGGEWPATSNLLGVKEKATTIMVSRHITKLDDAWIEDETGNKVAILNMNAYRRRLAHDYEWLTMH